MRPAPPQTAIIPSGPAATRSGIGRAELLRVLHRLERAEWPAAARALGFEAMPGDRPGSAPSEPATGRVDPARADADAETAPPAPGYRPSDLPDLPFWRIQAWYRLPPTDDGTPAWLQTTPAWTDLPLADPGRRPQPLPLAPPARQARLLRQALAAPRASAELDIPRLCHRLAEGRGIRRLPRRRRPIWPSTLRLVLDLSPSLTPFRQDLWDWVCLIRQILGDRVRLLISRDGQPADLIEDDGLTPFSGRLDDGTPLVILGDAGLYAHGSSRQALWLELAARCSRAGSTALLLAPCPSRLLRGDSLRRLRCVLLDRGRPLRLARRARGNPAHGRAEVAEPDSRSQPENQPQPQLGSQAGKGPDHLPDPQPVRQPSDDLLAALAPGARTEPPLLRRLRLLLADRGADIGWEHAVWNHPQVVSDELACAIRPAHRAAAEQRLAALPAPLRRAIQRAREAGNDHQSPLVRLEEALAAGDAAAGFSTALELARGWAATLQWTGDGALRRPLRQAIGALGRRRPRLLADYPELAAAWAVAHREALEQGALAELPEGLDLADLGWVLGARGQPRPLVLAQHGDRLALQSSGPGCPLLRIEAAGDYWELQPLAPVAPDGERESARPVADGPGPRVLRIGEGLTLAPDARYRLRVDYLGLDLETTQRPPWADAIGRHPDGLFADTADGRRLYWMPAGAADGFGAGVSTELMLPGAWWAEVLYRAWRGRERVLPVPDWAERWGVDNIGLWAEIQIRSVTQRFRWLPPGEFLMGSPEDEPEREEREVQHPVILSHGLWLADTACTQALWKVVLGEEPSYFKGPERPVEHVSWEDITERFLPALSELMPGLEPRLPTEAEWEYACRAGTRTPFSFGETLTTDQANYDGNYPYGNGPKGEYRQETIDVRALPANPWGLYQMHGNVYEWCSDWLGDDPSGPVPDPTGLETGAERVLRGGLWGAGAGWCRSAYGLASEPGYRHRCIGFRLARGPSPEQAKQARQAGGAGAAGVAAGAGAPAAAHAAPAPGQGGSGMLGLLRDLLGKRIKR